MSYMRASDILLEHFKPQLKQLINSSNRGMDFQPHSFAAWTSDENSSKYEYKMGYDDYSYYHNSDNHDNYIVVDTRTVTDTGLTVSDIAMAAPYSDDIIGSTKGVGILFECGNAAQLICLERTSQGDKATKSDQMRIAEKNEVIEQRYYEGQLDLKTAKRRMLRNLRPFAKVTKSSIDSKSFPVKIPV